MDLIGISSLGNLSLALTFRYFKLIACVAMQDFMHDLMLVEWWKIASISLLEVHE